MSGFKWIAGLTAVAVLFIAGVLLVFNGSIGDLDDKLTEVDGDLSATQEELETHQSLVDDESITYNDDEELTISEDGIGVAVLSSDVAGEGLSGGSGSPLDVNVDGSTITIFSDTLGVPVGGITSLELLDGTISGSDIGASAVGVDELSSAVAGPGLSGGSGSPLEVNVDGSTIVIAGDTLKVPTGGITTVEVLDETLSTDDLGTDSVDSDEIVADAVGLTELSSVVAGDGLSGGSGSALDVNVDGSTIVTSLDTLLVPTGGITTTEILDGTILFADIAGNGCSASDVFQYSGAAWVCGNISFDITDTGTTETVADGDTITFATGAGLSVSVAATDTVTYGIAPGGVGVTEISTAIAGDALVGGGGADLDVATDGSTIVTTGDMLSVPTSGITTTQILDGTIAFADVGANGCSAGEIMEYGGAAWVCGTAAVKSFDITDTVTTETVGDGDTVTFADGAGLTATVSATDTVTYGITAGGVGVTEISTALAGDALTGGGGADLDVVTDGATIVTTGDLLSVPTGGITTTQIFDGTIAFGDIGLNTCGAGDRIEVNGGGTAWSCGAAFTEVDGVIGNEVLNATTGGGLVRAGTGTGGDPYTLGLITTCDISEVLMWTGTAWACNFPTAPFAQVYDATGGTDPNTGAYVAIPFDTQTVVETGIDHDTVTDNTRVELEEIGTYFVTYNVSYDSAANDRRNVECAARLNGSTVITPSLSHSYVRNNTDDLGTNTASFLISTTATTDYYEIVCQGNGTTGVASTLAGESWTFVERLR